MTAQFSEEQVHEFVFAKGLEALIDDCAEIDLPSDIGPRPDDFDDDFQLWRIIKAKAMEKISRLHRLVRYGELIGSKIKLPIDKSKPMELDMLGYHEEGLFVLELKVNKSAERNAFSELFGYSNYLAEMFALSGAKDITNVLVANLDAKITRQALLYDLLIADRNIILYRPVVANDLEGLRLQLHLPTDEDFQHFTNQVLAHDSMSCVVTSFHDLPDWFDSEEEDGSLNEYTQKHLSDVCGYAAQLMEAERLHGFCFVRKRWKEIPVYYANSLIICATNPFRFGDRQRSSLITAQLPEKRRNIFFEVPELGFDGRLIGVAKRTIKDCLTHNYGREFETPLWSAMVTSGIEVAFTHNFGFRPTGIFREAYTGYLNAIYAAEADGKDVPDVSVLKVNEITNWFQAWDFMEMCGFTEEQKDDESPQ
jgi:hypothetical protein